MLFKMFCLSMLWGQAEAESTGGQALKRVSIGALVAAMSLPASVALDQLHWKAQRVTNTAFGSAAGGAAGGSAGAEPSSSAVSLIARSAMQCALHMLCVRTAWLAWTMAVDELCVGDVREKLEEGDAGEESMPARSNPDASV